MQGAANESKRSPTSGWPAWRSVIIPAEHGGWGFLLEPVLLGLLVAPTGAGLLLGLATVAAFLIRQPLKILQIDRRRKLHTARTQRARRAIVALAGGAGALAGVSFAVALGQAGPAFVTPLLLAIPFGAVFLYYDLTKPGRTLQAELAAPPAMAFVAPAMAMMGGWTLPAALALWVGLTARAIPSVIYVRARIRLDRGREPDLIWPAALHVLALIVIAALIWRDLLPATALIAYLLLLARAVWFLSPARPRISIKAIGFMEMGLGILTVLMLALRF